MNEGSTNSTTQTIITILKWIFFAFISFTALAVLIAKGYFSFFIFLLIALLLFPPLTNFWRAKLPFLKNRLAKAAILVVLFFIGALASPDFGKENYKVADEKEKTESEKITIKSDKTESEKTKEKIPPTTDKKTIQTIDYKILHKANIRYDNAPSYFVLIDEIDLTNEKFKNDIKNLINKIVTEKGAKISINFLDNKNALELMYKSHYGINSLGRILNKNELAQLERHSIASFDGELETLIPPNSLSFFSSAFTSSPKVGKYVETIEYNPVVKDNRIVKKQRAELEKQKAQSEKKKKDFEENCFSSWEGSCRALVKYVKENMNDPSSFEHVKTTYYTLDDYAVVIMKFRGNNAYGNLVLGSIKAKVSYDCKVLEIMQ